MLRHSSAGAAQFLAERLDASVINAGDGAHEHPTQALLDTFTIREKLGRIAGIHVAIIGDILFSRVARSNIHALLKLGAHVTLVGPSTLVPREFERMGVHRHARARLRAARGRRGESPAHPARAAAQGIFPQPRRIHRALRPHPAARAEKLKPGALIMHPGPINRGVEIDSDIADSARSVILDQVTNGLAVRMAVLYLCAGGERNAQ